MILQDMICRVVTLSPKDFCDLVNTRLGELGSKVTIKDLSIVFDDDGEFMIGGLGDFDESSCMDKDEFLSCIEGLREQDNVEGCFGDICSDFYFLGRFGDVSPALHSIVIRMVNNTKVIFN